MTAEGKITAARLETGDRILVRRTTTPDVVIPATAKTGPDTVSARVASVEKLHARGGGHFGTVGARSRLRVTTDAGTAIVPSHQTFWAASSRKTTPTTPKETAMTTTIAKGANRPAAAARRAKAAQKPTTSKPVAAVTLPEDFPGAAKITRLLDGAKKSGWTVTLSGLNAATGAATVTCTRGTGERAESIVSEFIGGKSAGRAAHTVDGTPRMKLPNVSAVLHAMAGTKPGATPAPAPAPAARPARKRAAISQAAAA